MITCSSYRGQAFNPISQFDCLSTDVPNLPRNKKGRVIEDISINCNLPSEITIKENTFLHKINLFDMPKEANYIQVKSLYIFRSNELEKNKTSIPPSIIRASKRDDYKHYGGLDPNIGKIDVSKEKYLLVDIDIDAIQKNEFEGGKINKIILDLYFYKDDKEIKNIQFSFIITVGEHLIQENLNKHGIFSSYDTLNITNGSIAFCMDTSEVYKFDEEYDRWLKL